MGWISFDEAIKKAGVSKYVGRNRLKYMQEKQPEIYNRIVREEGQSKEFRTPEIVGYFKTKLCDLKKKEQLVTIRGTKSKLNVPITFIPNSLTKKVEKMMQEPVILQLSKKAQDIFDKITNEDDRDRLLIMVAVFEEYEQGFFNFDDCCRHQGITRSNAWRWIRIYEHLKLLYKAAKRKRSKAIKEMEVDDYHNTVRLLSKGFTREEVTNTYVVRKDIKGKEILIPKEKKVTEKHYPPSLAAAMFGLTNRAPKDWKRFTPLEQLINQAEKKNEIDAFDNMSEEELRKFIADNSEPGKPGNETKEEDSE